ncbi:MAG: HAD family hydrolase [Candidatus Thermoplasmatota archaeon]|jgi:phosphoglycolate phosphatase|nr:HAD family hydrolase [Candidatus Thermoplasmatota archaeon]MCL5787188.1 HAD family hydrolase [Candidatus Thermoplasmatota archaeon]
MIVNGVIFDLDGTILNSFRQRVHAWKMAFEDQEIFLQESDIESLIGLPGMDLAGKFSNNPELTEKLEEEYFVEMLPQISLYEDYEETVARLKSMGIKTIIVTSSRRELVRRLNLGNIQVVTIDDVVSGKPDIEAYVKAAEILKVNIKNMVAVGDSINDMIPAKTLGIPAILITHGRKTNITLYDFLIKDLSDLIDCIKNL